MPTRRWTDAQLREAIATCTTWTAVYAHLGLRGRSDAVRNRCHDLGLDYGHIGTPESRRRWTDDQLTAAVAESTNMRQVFVALGLAVGGGTWMMMQDHIRRLGLDTTHWDRALEKVRPPREVFRWDRSEMQRACEGARSVREVMRRLGLDPDRKRGRAAVERHMRELGVAVDELPGQAWAKGGSQSGRRGRPLEELLVAGSPALNTYNLKRRLVNDGVLPWRCALCGIEDWQGRPLALQLDHVNGDRYDNRRENLRLLCPNCHSQTETFAGRNSATRYSPARIAQ